MEQRLVSRSPSNHAGWIWFGGMPPLAATVGNVSADGLLLKLTHPALTPAAVINVTVEDAENQCMWISRAIVIHTSRAGTGVRLLNGASVEWGETGGVVVV